MIIDLTYNEIKRVKNDLREFDNYLYSLAMKKGVDISENDISFFNFIGKRIIFFKYFKSGSSEKSLEHFCKVIISDLYNLLLSILDEKYRYVYLNERSIIENYCRLILNRTIENDHITSSLFESLKEIVFEEFNQDEYSLLKSEYTTACEFVHGGEVISNSLMFVLEEYESYSWSKKEKNEYYDRIRRIFKFLEKLLVSQYTDYVDGCFLRRKSLLEFLLNKDILDIIFQNR
ncbi:hypothetical protein [Enterococcus gallinarum]|uniref:hypothetical protein n=1 Tax=Enterococcus gallinarum TaxID=1353 RepID=UPI0035DF4765